MLSTIEFVRGLVKDGYSHVCVVPCSFAKNVINEVINNPDIEYLPCASEAVACSVAAGLKISGSKPVVIAQSSGLANMGSCITSLLKPYGIQFPILVSWRTYKEGDSEVQHAHLATKLPSLIEAYGYGFEVMNRDNVDTSLLQLRSSNEDFKICIIEKDTFDSVELLQDSGITELTYIERSKFLLELNSLYANTDKLFIGTTGNTAREMYSFMPDTENFYMAGNMGGALSLGLGVALSGKETIVCGGDAEFVMHMGGVTTSGRYSEANLLYILFDNEVNKSTGGQATEQAHLNYIDICKSSGFLVFDEIVTSLDSFKQALTSIAIKQGPRFIHVKCGLDEVTKRPPLDVVTCNSVKSKVE